MTSSSWLTVGIVIAGIVAGGLVNWILPPSGLGQKTIIMLACLAIAVAVVLTVIAGRPDKPPRPIVVADCPRLFDQAHGLLMKSPLAAPPVAGIAFTPSREVPGRVDLSLSWINPVPITQSGIAIQGVYGQDDPGDDSIDHRQPAAAAGECWNWYHFGLRDDAQPKTVRIRVSQLWPGQKYCFYTTFRISTGYSRPTAIRCVTATWKPDWGTPAQVPAK